MILPQNVSEADFLTAVDKVVNLLASSFTFGYFTVEDIKQQARLFAIEGMRTYDPTRPLDNFLYSHVKNRLINFRRDKFRRNDPPCKDCHTALEGETKHPDRRYCERYRAWLRRNNNKQNIMNPLDISYICDEHERNTRVESTVVADVERGELLGLIDAKLSVEHRQIYLQMRAGENVPKAKREEIEREVLQIISENSECLID